METNVKIRKGRRKEGEKSDGKRKKEIIKARRKEGTGRGNIRRKGGQ